MSEEKPDLSGLLNQDKQEEEEEAQGFSQEEVDQIEAVAHRMEEINSETMMTINTLSQRVATLERLVSYLMRKDPEVKDKIEAMASDTPEGQSDAEQETGKK